MRAISTKGPLTFSLGSLLIAVTGVALALGVYRSGFDPQVVVHYCFLLFTVGPWFAHLAAECLPVAAPQLRTATANMILLGLFIITLTLAEATLPGPVTVVVAVAAVVLWTPQYMIFFVWRMGD